MEFLIHLMGETMLYVLVKIPLYAYDTAHECKYAMKHYKRRWHSITARIRRLLYAHREDDSSSA